MNLTTISDIGISTDALEKARPVAIASKRRLIDVLMEQLNLSAADFVACLGQTLYYPVLNLDDLSQLAPA